MPADIQSLTRNWIQFLKNNQIVDLKSDPATGKLTYKKKVTSTELTRFLQVKTDYSEEQILNAIRMVLAKNNVNGGAPKLSNTVNTGVATQPAGRPAPKSIAGPRAPAPPAPRRKYNNDDAEDVEYKDSVAEALIDAPGDELSEDDIEQIFRILTSRSPRAAAPPAPAEDPAQLQAAKEEKIRKIKRLVRDTMSDTQRKALWRALTDA